MKKVVLALGLCCVIGFSTGVPTYATTYYVDWDNGSHLYNGLYPSYQGGIDGPWKTPWYADDQLTSGDTVVIAAKNDGSPYNNGTSRVIEAPDGTTWQAANGETVKISITKSWGDVTWVGLHRPVVTIDSNVMFNRFYVWGQVYIIGDNNIIQNCDLSGGNGGVDAFPAVLYIHGSLLGDNDASGNLVRNNRIHDNVGTSPQYPNRANAPLVMAYYEDGTIYENNEIYNSVGPGIFNKSAPEDVIIRCNFFHDNAGPAIQGSEGNMHHGGDQTYYQNVFINGHLAPYQAGSYYYIIYNNTFYNTHLLNKWTAYQNVYFFNNIAYGATTKYAVYTEGTFTTSMFDYLDYNTYYNTGGNYEWEFNYSIVASSLSDWQNYLGTQGEEADTMETSSDISNPNFLNASGNFNTPMDFKRGSYPTDGRGGSWPSVRGAYITGNEIIGTGGPPTPELFRVKSIQ